MKQKLKELTREEAQVMAKAVYFGSHVKGYGRDHYESCFFRLREKNLVRNLLDANFNFRNSPEARCVSRVIDINR